MKTKYLGLELKNPIIVGAGDFMSDLDIVKRLEESGAAALVYKSLFEEQVQMERLEMEEDLNEYNERHPEMTTLFPAMKHAGPKEHLLKLKKVVDAVDIPVIGSLNCTSTDVWVDYAKQVAGTGVKALELNFYFVPGDFDTSGEDIEKEQLANIKAVKKAVGIPVSVKLSAQYSNPLNVIRKMSEAGADAVVMFNRFFQPDINVDKQELYAPFFLSNHSDHFLPLRFTGLLSGKIKADICANSGIFTGTDVVKMLLAGADAVQIVSAIYLNKVQQIPKMLDEVEIWMKENKYDTISDFKGKLSREKIADPYAYTRAQYIEILMRSAEILNKSPQV